MHPVEARLRIDFYRLRERLDLRYQLLQNYNRFRSWAGFRTGAAGVRTNRVCPHPNAGISLARTSLISRHPRPVVHCPDCDLFFVKSLPPASHLRRLYGKSYFERLVFPFQKLDGSPEDEGVRATHARLLELVGHDPESFSRKKYFEIGCALGGLMVDMKERGWEVHGTDISEYAIDYVRNRRGIASVTMCEDIRELSLETDCFDFVNLTHTVEHLIDPVGCLEEIRRILSPRGVVFIVTPDAERDPHDFYHPEHLQFFTRKSLHYYLDRLGFSPCIVLQDPETPWLVAYGPQQPGTASA